MTVLNFIKQLKKWNKSLFTLKPKHLCPYHADYTNYGWECMICGGLLEVNKKVKLR